MDAYPFNYGFVFAAEARELATGRVPGPGDGGMGPQQYVFVLLLVALVRLTGLTALQLAQPAIAVIGTVPALLALLVVREIGAELGWSGHRTFVAATLAGIVLATEGLYLHRSVTVSDEVLGLLFVPAIALCVHRFFESSRQSWLGAAGLMLLALPLTHHFSTMIAAVTHRLGGNLARSPADTDGPGGGNSGHARFWIYLLAYHSQFTPSSANRITTNPALFVAWVIAIAALAHWFRTVRPASSRGVISFGVLALNAIRPVFPGTAFDRDRVDVRP